MDLAGNCNMVIINYCAYRNNCASAEELYPAPMFVNPFRHNCTDNKFPIIHNKCKATAGYICLQSDHQTLELSRKRQSQTCVIGRKNQGTDRNH